MQQSTHVICIKNLLVQYGSCCTTRAIAGIDLCITQGSSVGIIGESGSGKSTLALMLLRLLSKNAKVSGSIQYLGEDVLAMDEQTLNDYRWNKVAIAFQNSLDILNPVMTVFQQLLECVQRHSTLDNTAAQDCVSKNLDLVGLPATFHKAYPHQLSGGMRQRVLLAMAISCNPEVLLIDEPTTALDSISKAEIVNLIKRLHKEQGFTLIVISHEFEVIANLTNRLYVMYAGRFVEEGLTKEILKKPLHPYTRGLLYASPAINPYRDLWGIPSEFIPHHHHGCSFVGRCSQSLASCAETKPDYKLVGIERRVACHRGGIVKVLEAYNIKKSYKEVTACTGCNVTLYAGEVTVLIGQSGSGKTTLASILAGIFPADSGEIRYMGEAFTGNKFTSRIGGIQMVFQDPFSAINENLSVADAILEPLLIHQKISADEKSRLVLEQLRLVQLPLEECFGQRKCYSLSGGQRQRVSIARALIMQPKLLIADEINSMLDPSTQANILRLLKGLQNSQGFTMLYVTHDLLIAKKIADNVIVMKDGSVIETGITTDVFEQPRHAYTKELIEKTIMSKFDTQ